MNLIRLLLHTSVTHLTLAVITGILSGISAVGLIALINTTLNQNNTSISFLQKAILSLILTRTKTIKR